MSTSKDASKRDISVSNLSFLEMNQVIDECIQNESWDQLWPLIKNTSATQAAHILFQLDRVGWIPSDHISEYQDLKRAFSPCRIVSPPFKKRISVSAEFGNKRRTGIIYTAPSCTWDRLLTVKKIRHRFDRDEKPSDNHYDLIDIWKMPNGTLESSFRITNLTGTNTFFVVDDNLSVIVVLEFGELRVFQLDPGHPKETPLEPIVSIELGISVSFGVDFVQESIYAITRDGDIVEYGLRTGIQERTLSLDGYHSEEETSPSRMLLRFDRAQHRVVVSTSAGDVIFVDQGAWKVTGTIRTHQKAIDEIQISHDGRFLATSVDAITRIWDIEGQQITAELVDVDNPFATQDEQGNWYQSLPDNTLFETVSEDHSRVLISDGNDAYLYSLRKGATSKGKCFEHSDDIRWMTVSRCMDPRVDLAVYEDSFKVVLQDLSRRSANLVVRGVGGTHGVLCPVTKQLGILGEEEIRVIPLKDQAGFNSLSDKPAVAYEIQIKDLESVVSVIPLPEGVPSSVIRARVMALSPEQVFVGTTNGEVWFRHLERGSTSWEQIVSIDGDITALCVSDSPVASLGIGSAEGQVLVYDLENRRPVKDLQISGATITSIGLSSRIPWGVTWTASIDAEVRLYASPFTALVGKSYAGRTQAIEFHPDQPTVVTGDFNALRFWSIEEQLVLFPLPVKDRPGMSTRHWDIRFTPSGYHLLYNVRGDKPYFLDPRSYILRFVPVRAYTERDLDWLKTLKEAETDTEWAEFLMKLHKDLRDRTLFNHTEGTRSVSLPGLDDSTTDYPEAGVISDPEHIDEINRWLAEYYGPIFDFDNEPVPVGGDPSD
jgi:WD40 repeat protein